MRQSREEWADPQIADQSQVLGQIRLQLYWLYKEQVGLRQGPGIQQSSSPHADPCVLQPKVKSESLRLEEQVGERERETALGAEQTKLSL